MTVEASTLKLANVAISTIRSLTFSMPTTITVTHRDVNLSYTWSTRKSTQMISLTVVSIAKFGS